VKYKVRHNLLVQLIGVDIRQLRAFAAVAAELNFVRAAKRLRLSQPALSQTIRQLELALGLQLFDRDTRHVSLTGAGTLILEDVHQVLERYQALIDRSRDLTRGRCGTLKVGYLIGAGVDIVPVIIRTFAEQFPDVHMILREYDFSTPEAGINGEVDVAILRPPIDCRDVELITLVEEPCVACLPQGHRLAAASSVSVFDLLDEPIVAAPGRGVWRDYWLACTYRNGRLPNVVFEAPTFESELQAVAAGRGISITAMAASRFYSRPGLAFPPINDMPPCHVSVAVPRDAPRLAHEFALLATTTAKHLSCARLVSPLDAHSTCGPK
jgi:DNA-binding transcriptional LysR family regulator